MLWIRNLRQQTVIYPPQDDVFRAFLETPFNKIKVVILGQDPYHDGNADGLAFSCKERISPSLTKIFESLSIPYDKFEPVTLKGWAAQGVLLLNTVLTVEKGFPGSHAGKGWEIFTTRVIKELIVDTNPKVFLLWGNNAQTVFDDACVYDMDVFSSTFNHIKIYESEHPAAASYADRVWKGGINLTLANGALAGWNLKTINWNKYKL